VPELSLSKNPQRIAGMFDAIAARYDLLNHLLSAGIDRWWRRQAIRSLRLTGQERVLDLCAGTADLSIAAARAGARRVLGIDIAGAMLQVGRQKVARNRLESRITLLRGDATQVPVADGAVSAVTIAFGIRNVNEPARACAEIRRVLAPGGRLAILEFAVPTNAVVRGVYLWYFKHVLPLVGAIISRHDSAYGYLPASVGAFQTPSEFSDLLHGSGFSDVQVRPLTFGIVILYTARK
jgi:demethylmenaquinone methyltransferase/2-methoxy-6-polyprenyl-1,4-benzoquinol methylase